MDGPEREWARLAWRIGLDGVPDLHAALADQRLEPLVDAVARFLEDATLRRIAGAALATSDSAAERRSRGGAFAHSRRHGGDRGKGSR